MLSFEARVTFDVPDGTDAGELAHILDYIKLAVENHRYTTKDSAPWKMENVDVPSFSPVSLKREEG